MWLHMILDNGVHQTKYSVNLPKELCHYYLEAKGNTAYQFSINYGVYNILATKELQTWIGLSLHILYYGFIKVPYYMLIC